ncbi:MAG: hypothetical protein BJ554DRAFT_2229 [Olpidium bornovanus]|uniref:Uncharacterized protein n=1 Tax=Olpidium bornovanus TaxID=278681 RepID=A0A8H7ZQT8_9FUNG|nr:MAG: hypothetical protein BJ554DRAFT_2229 [Olpidium bornovanus]
MVREFAKTWKRISEPGELNPTFKGHSVAADAEAGHAVLVGREHAHPLALEGVPNVAVEIVVASKQQPAGNGERDRGDAAQNVVMRVLVELAVRPQIKQAAAGVIGTGAERVAIREELHCIDVRLVARKRLHAAAGADVPHLGRGVTRPGNEDVLVRRKRKAGWCENKMQFRIRSMIQWSNASPNKMHRRKRCEIRRRSTPGTRLPHHVTGVIGEFESLHSRVDVPQHATHVSRGSKDLPVGNEPAAGEVTRVRIELPGHLNGALLGLEVVNGADVVETAARHEPP